MSELLVRHVDVAPDIARLTACLAAHPGAFSLSSTTPLSHAYLGAYPSCVRDGWDPEPELLAYRRGSLATVPRWVGILPYEACRGIEQRTDRTRDFRPPAMVQACRWWRYPAVVVVERDVRVVGEDPSSVARLAAILVEEPRVHAGSIESVTAVDSDAEHGHRVRCILSAIARGEVYQVNLARRFRFEAEGAALSLLLLLSKRCRAPFGFGFTMDDGTRIAGISPELCLSLSAEGWLLTRPIKGTCPRGRSEQEDLALGRALSDDPKERAELAMVVDLERNDLSRIAEVGTVRVLSAAALETFDSVHHRTASVVGRLRAGVTRTELLSAFLPSGSVTGTPKIAAMRMIAQLEPARRGLYCGAYGYLAHDGSLRLGMAIRTLVATSSGVGEYFSGGGIVADSLAEREVAETGWKSRVIVEPCTPPGQPDPSRPPGWSFCRTAENWAGWPDCGSERNSTHGS